MPARHYRAGPGASRVSAPAWRRSVGPGSSWAGTLTVPARRYQAGPGYHGSPRRRNVAQSPAGWGVGGDAIRVGQAFSQVNRARPGQRARFFAGTYSSHRYGPAVPTRPAERPRAGKCGHRLLVSEIYPNLEQPRQSERSRYPAIIKLEEFAIPSAVCESFLASLKSFL